MDNDQIEIQIDEAGIKALIVETATQTGIATITETKNLDGELICSIIGTAISVSTFCLELYKTVSDKKKVKYISKKHQQAGLSLKKASELALKEEKDNKQHEL